MPEANTEDKKQNISKNTSLIKRLNIKVFILAIVNFIKNFPKNLPIYIKSIKSEAYEIFVYIVLLTIFIIGLLVTYLLKLSWIPNYLRNYLLKFTNFLSFISKKFNKPLNGVLMNRMDLFELAFKNMGAKKSRTLITVGGMAVGVGTIIFLVTLGYGLQKLVIDRVARLDEIKQADVTTQTGSNIRITDKSVEDFKKIPNVSEVLPLIGLVAKVNFQGSVSDVAVYGVTSSYLRNSAVKPIEGQLFDIDKISLGVDALIVEDPNNKSGEVAGAKDEVLDKSTYLEKVKYSIFPRSWVRVRSGPDTNSKVLGYTKRVEGIGYGDEVLGSWYDYEGLGGYIHDTTGSRVGKWIKSKVYIWEENACDITDADCYDGKYKVIRDDSGSQSQVEGYFAQIEMVVDYLDGSVLGVSTQVAPETNSDALYVSQALGTSTNSVDSDDPNANNLSLDLNSLFDNVEETSSSSSPDTVTNDDLEFVDMLFESSASATVQTKKLKLPPEASRKAVVNIAFLNILGIEKNRAVGKTFDASFVVTSDLLENELENVVSENDSYEIVAVIPGDDIPFFYVPLSDLKVLGINNYSQVKVLSKDKNDLSNIREKIEAMGFGTDSVADTITRINSLFGTVRFVLGVVGAVALSVAALGMFNTLTVSLLERVREIGLMKAMGMTSSEVKRLFLTESMMMGLMGGVFGIIFGFVGGKILSLCLSFVGIMKGVGFIDVIYLPPLFALAVFVLSVIVGLVTGIYPSRRATKISALNALRYE